MLEKLKYFDTEVFFLINSHHHSFFDKLMYGASDKLIWIPFYIFLAAIIYKNTKSELWIILIAVAALILFTDQLSVLIKNSIMRYRPCHNLAYGEKVHLVSNCGGQFGFISSHAANTFGLASLLFFILKNKIKWLMPVLFSWSIFISYSRIYLGQHYPLDVIGGWITGAVVAFIISKIYFYFRNKKQIQT